jgi:hypothetical protein
LYGMNLNNFIEETDWGFGSVSVICFGLSWAICIYGMRKLRKVQKVRMWGEGLDHSVGFRKQDGKIGGRGNWHNEAIESHAHRIGRLKGTGVHVNGNPQAGRVLWPGMEGLGMHRLNNSEGQSQDQHRRSDTGDDDVDSLEERMKADSAKEKGLIPHAQLRAEKAKKK